MCQEQPHCRPELRSEDEKLIRNLRRCGHYLRHHTEEKGSQRRVLFLLRRNGPMTQKDLLDAMGVRAGSLSELLSKLEARGCIAKEKSEADKRNYNVTLTPAGSEALEELQRQYQDSMAALLADFPDEDKIELNRLLEKLQNTWPD